MVLSFECCKRYCFFRGVSRGARGPSDDFPTPRTDGHAALRAPLARALVAPCQPENAVLHGTDPPRARGRQFGGQDTTVPVAAKVPVVSVRTTSHGGSPATEVQVTLRKEMKHRTMPRGAVLWAIQAASSCIMYNTYYNCIIINCVLCIHGPCLRVSSGRFP